MIRKGEDSGQGDRERGGQELKEVIPKGENYSKGRGLEFKVIGKMED